MNQTCFENTREEWELSFYTLLFSHEMKRNNTKLGTVITASHVNYHPELNIPIKNESNSLMDHMLLFQKNITARLIFKIIITNSACSSIPPFIHRNIDTDNKHVDGETGELIPQCLMET